MSNTPDDEIATAPKFFVDRSAYGPALEGWIGRTVAGAHDVTISDLHIPVATGFSNETVLFTAHWTEQNGPHEERLVARIEPASGALFPTQTAAAAVSVGLQYRIMNVVAEHSHVPVPGCLGYEADASVLGQPFFVMRFVDGVVPADQPRYSKEGFLVDEASPEQRRRLVETGLAAMAEVHNIDWRGAGLDWLDTNGVGDPTTADQLALYRRFVIDTLDGREHPVMMSALDWLDANDPHDARVGLTWGDARLGNIIWADYEPGAVVDWEACALCPTEADVGWWLMFDRMSFDEMDAPRLEGFPTREEMIQHYESVSGREVRAPHYWEVFAVMRFCAIFIRLADRMVSTGAVPAELNMSIANQVTASLAQLLGIRNETPPSIPVWD